jgi:cytoskeletal protein RodZ
MRVGWKEWRERPVFCSSIIANQPENRLGNRRMPSVAEQLRTAREARGLDVYQVAESTKIKTEHIRALEEGDFSPFTAPVYIRGFTRTLATLLRLDVPRVMADLDIELGQTTKFREPPSLLPNKRGVIDFIMLQLSKLNWAVVLPVVVIVLLIAGSYWGYTAYRRQKTENPLSGLGPGVYQPKQTSPGEHLTVPTNAPGRK